MHSAIYTGQLRHRRFAPLEHSFSYDLFMMFVDLAELDDVFAKRWLWSAKRPALAWLRRADFLGDETIPLDRAVRDRVESDTGVRPTGPIRMLTHLRYFGLSFNPVTFYYCYDLHDRAVDTIVAEITNTPWNERFAYVLTQQMNIGADAIQRYRFRKAFHVSPFLNLDYDYDWRFSAPTPPAKRLTVHMENHRDGKVFDATLDLKRRELSSAALASTLLFFPVMTMKVVAGIYWQALRLWLKRVPVHSHPTRI
jgi:DUF1365 family protein